MSDFPSRTDPCEELSMTTITVPASDFYGLERTLEPSELAVVHAVRAFMRDEVEPIINDYWTRARFPFQILDGFRRTRHRRPPL